MIPGLGGAGGFSASASSSASTGDQSAGLDSSWNYNSAFQVGGSGKQSQDAGLTASKGGETDKTLIYVAGGVGALFALGFLISSLRK